MTELEKMTEVADGHKGAYETLRKAFDMLSDERLHDFRCAALSGICSIFTLHKTGEKAGEFCMPTFEAQASCAEGIAQAMLKIARGEV